MSILNGGKGCVAFGGALDAHPIAEMASPGSTLHVRLQLPHLDPSLAHIAPSYLSVEPALTTELTAQKTRLGGKFLT